MITLLSLFACTLALPPTGTRGSDPEPPAARPLDTGEGARTTDTGEAGEGAEAASDARGDERGS
jgi:hypothetical protein